MFIGEPESTIFEVGESKIHGHGILAKGTYPPGTRIGTSHMLTVVRHGVMASAITDLGRFINHSTTPNCRARIIFHDLMIDTIEHIDKGVELTVDYTDFKPVLNIESPKFEKHD